MSRSCPPFPLSRWTITSHSLITPMSSTPMRDNAQFRSLYPRRSPNTTCTCGEKPGDNCTRITAKRDSHCGGLQRGLDVLGISFCLGYSGDEGFLAGWENAVHRTREG